ncbi:MAG: hypothetical protein EPO20_20740 [Betaproteobacteria bacterium]|nr:MAG: hypothetical protein EPO20_20740 [Betaproteobacteria bacterium]
MEISRTQLILLSALAQILLSPVAFADARQTFQEERARCMSGPPDEDRAACLKEAGAALQAAKRGELQDNPGVYETNRLARCAYLPKGEREDCERRMQGEGTTSGSVEGGGIYRELRTQVPAGE